MLRGASDPSPQFDPRYHSTFDMPSWGSPSPRIEAAQGLTHLLWNWGREDSEVTKAIHELSPNAKAKEEVKKAHKEAAHDIKESKAEAKEAQKHAKADMDESKSVAKKQEKEQK